MLKGKCAIITGGVRGIGGAIAVAFAKQGCNLVLTYVGDSAIAEPIKAELAPYDIEYMIVESDVSSFDDTATLIDNVVERFGKIDILVNNAGITRDGMLMRMSEEAFDSVLNVNLKGTFNCIRHTAPIMLKQKSGRIISISSVVGLHGNAGQANYCASKAGIVGLTKSVAKELGSRGITVNAIAPGFIDTLMTADLSDKIKEALMSQLFIKRLGSVEDIANTALFLASDNASYITGQVISVDGGMTM